MLTKPTRSRKQAPDVEGALKAFDRILAMPLEELRAEHSNSLATRVEQLTRSLKEVQSHEELESLLRQELVRQRPRSSPRHLNRP